MHYRSEHEYWNSQSLYNTIYSMINQGNTFCTSGPNNWNYDFNTSHIPIRLASINGASICFLPYACAKFQNIGSLPTPYMDNGYYAPKDGVMLLREGEQPGNYGGRSVRESWFPLYVPFLTSYRMDHVLPVLRDVLGPDQLGGAALIVKQVAINCSSLTKENGQLSASRTLQLTLGDHLYIEQEADAVMMRAGDGLPEIRIRRRLDELNNGGGR